MSELFMECEEEELEPWQRQIPEINLVDDDEDDDDEPIFVGEIHSSKSTTKTKTSLAPVVKPVNQRNTSAVSLERTGTTTMIRPQNSPPVGVSKGQPGVGGLTGATVPQLSVRGAAQSVTKSILIPVTSPSGIHNVPRTTPTVSQQPIIINNQGYIVTSPQMSKNPFIASLGSQYPPGTSFTVVPAGQQLLQQVTPGKPVPGVVHRPQVQLIHNNVVTLSNVTSPAVLSTQPSAPLCSQTSAQRSAPPSIQPPAWPSIQPPGRSFAHAASPNQQPALVNSAKVPPIQVLSSPSQTKLISSLKQGPSAVVVSKQPPVPTVAGSSDNAKRTHPQSLDNDTAKRAKLDTGNVSAYGATENGVPFRKKCPKCNIQFNLPDPMKSHMRYCCSHLLERVFPSTSKTVTPSRIFEEEKGKLIMLVKDFYYGRYEGDKHPQLEQKTNTTFKCNSCLKVLKNNVRFMNHMKHHLELEKQNSESWESHTTCQHCYRQYATPFQLQCHIECAHSPYESTTNCKICELAFESEQVLLEHMKDNHKPGEMPYVCQVCNYRSSFFSEVETHFRSVHDNTKDLLCPFCLKVLRSGHIYMQHYMKHQKKGIHRCGKCRLNFLTYKERTEHKAQVHRTFRKPKTLEGLPPGTKVTIRASLAAASPTSPSSASNPGRSVVSIMPSSPLSKSSAKALANAAKSKSTTQSSTVGRPKSSQSKKNDRFSNPKFQQNSNSVLKNSRMFGHHTCIECYTEVKDFYAHYPVVLNCGACKYRTSCKISYGNHMIRFHSTISKDRFRRMRKPRGVLRSLTLVCLNCDFLADAAGSDLMSKHLIDRPHHNCQVIFEREMSAGECSVKGNTLEVTEVSADEFSDPMVVGSQVLSEDVNTSHSSPKNRKSSDDRVSDDQSVTTAETEDSETSQVGQADKEESQDDHEAEEKELTQVQATDRCQGAGESKASGEPCNGEEEVLVQEFLGKPAKADSVSSDARLEPLTPSRVLEHQATEILQVPSNQSTELGDVDNRGTPPSPNRKKEAASAQ